jgi:hypothetical protein
MKEVIHNVRVSDIPAAIRQLGLPEDMSVQLTIEDQDDATRALMDVVGEIRAHARQQGLTDARLDELLADAS